MMPRGRSRVGVIDSSAASGSCSMARNSQTAKGRAANAPVETERQQRPVAVRQLDRLAVRPGADIEGVARELGLGDRRDPEHREAGQRRQGHDHGHAERQLDAPDVQPDEQRVAPDPVERQRPGGVSNTALR